MSEASSSIMFVAVPRPNPAPPESSGSSSASRENSESQDFVNESSNSLPHFIHPKEVERTNQRSRFGVHVRPHNPLKPTIVRSHSANIAALNRLYMSGVQKMHERKVWAQAEQEKKEKSKFTGCTFHPEISSFASQLHRPRQMSPEYRFRDEIAIKEETLAVKRSQKEVKEIAECTFRPLTLRAAYMDPQSYVGRADRHVLLYREAESRKEMQRHLANMLEHEAVRTDKMPLLEEEELGLVGRLSRPIVRESPQEPKFEPLINEHSKRLAASHRARDASPRSAVERLYHGKPSPRSRSAHVPEIHPFVPQLNPKTEELLISRQIAHISGLFNLLGDGKTACSVVDLAKGALKKLSLTDAEDVVSILRVTRRSTLSQIDFVDLCLRREFASKAVLHAPARAASARRDAKKANPKNNNKFEEPTFSPRLDPYSEFLVRARKSSPSRLYAVNGAAEKGPSDANIFPFKPTINPLPDYIVNMRKNVNVHRQSDLSRRSPTPSSSEGLVSTDSRGQKEEYSLFLNRFPTFASGGYSETQIAERYGYSSSPASSGGIATPSKSAEKNQKSEAFNTGGYEAESLSEGEMLALLNKRRNRSPF